MTASKFSFPLRVENLLTQAGASVYTWYDAEVSARLDPEGKLRAWSERGEVGAFFAGMAVASFVLTSASGQALWIVGIAVVYLLANWAVGRGVFAAPWAWTVVMSSVSAGLAFARTGGEWMLVSATVALGAWLLSRLVMRVYRDSVMVAFHVGLSLVGGGLLSLGTRGLLLVATAVLAGACSGWLIAFALQGRRAMSPLPVRLRREQFTWTLPDPPSTVPFLLRRRVRAFEKAASADRRRGVRSAEDAAIDKKKVGGAGERRTALLLLGLKSRRWTRIAHDVVVPGATEGANADHVVLARSGGWVIDSKQFGTLKDPGVVRRTNVGEIVHASGARVHDLEQSLMTVAWAARGIRDAMGFPFRGLLVVHNADVEPGLSVVVPARPGVGGGDVRVDIISSRFLIGYLDSAVQIMSPWEVSSAQWGFRAKLVSATTGTPPELVSPIGGGPSVTPQAAPVPQEWGERRAPLRESVTALLGGRRGLSGPEGTWTPVEEPASAEVGQGAVDEVRALGIPDPAYAGEDPAQFVDRRVREHWGQIDLSEPAAPDDVPAGLRGVRPGVRMSYIGFTADGSDVLSLDLVAASVPCQGVDGAFVWACSPAQWDVHVRTGRPVNVGSYRVDSLALVDQEGA